MLLVKGGKGNVPHDIRELDSVWRIAKLMQQLYSFRFGRGRDAKAKTFCYVEPEGYEHWRPNA